MPAAEEGTTVATISRGWKWPALVIGLVLMSSVAACSNSSSSAGGSEPDATIFVQNFKYNGVPSTLSSGIVTLLFQNKESFEITHEMIPIQLPSGKTSDDVISEAKTNGPESEDGWLHIGGDFGAISTDASLVETLYLPPGTYAFACWQTGTQSGGENGPPHAAKGMVAQFTVT
jgi:hypothetical protein